MDFAARPEILSGFMLVCGAAFLFLFGFTFVGFRRIERKLQKLQVNLQARDRKMQDRERFVVASALEGELTANRAKLDAFLIIYEEMLKSLRDPTRKPKYQKSGDIIHERPALTRAVFDANREKTALLGPVLAQELEAVYAQIDPDPEFTTVEPETPLQQVVVMVDRILTDIQAQVEPMDRLITTLTILARDKRQSVAS